MTAGKRRSDASANGLPSVGDSHPASADIATAGGGVLQKPPEALVKDGFVTVLLPPAPPPGGYNQRHLQLQLETLQSMALSQLHAALDARQDKLANGRLITSKAEAIRWLL